MESFEIMSWRRAELFRPSPSVRSAIQSDEDLPFDMNQVLTADGQVSISRVLGQVALRPRSLPGLVRLGQAESGRRGIARAVS